MRARPIIFSSIHKTWSQKKRQTLIASGLALFSFDKLHYVNLFSAAVIFLASFIEKNQIKQ